MDRSKYLRITEIISPFTGIEFVPEHVLAPASEKGTCVHEAIESLLNGFGNPSCDLKIEPYVESFERFFKESPHLFDGEMILEERLYCDEYKITGQMDCIVKTEDKTYLMDWKTSSQYHKSWMLQGAAYRFLCSQNSFTNIEGVIFVKLNKKGGKPSIYKEEEYIHHLDTFFKCYDLYHWFDMANTRRPR